MICFEGTTSFETQLPSAITLGKFDGLHLGHQKLLNHIRRQKEKGLQAVVFIIAPEGRPRLLTDQEELEKLKEFGADVVIFCPFVPEILHQEAEEFVENVLVRRLKAKEIVVGPDFRFGRNRQGDDETLKKLSGRFGFHVTVLEKEKLDGREISSTYVREAIEEGNMELAERLLGYPYFVSGEVLHGRALGRTLNIPTANLSTEERKILPPFGVYFSRVWIRDQVWHGTTNIGIKPTVGSEHPGVETYLHGFSGNIYGEQMKVELLKLIRREMKFDSVEALKNQMQSDIAAGEAFANER